MESGNSLASLEFAQFQWFVGWIMINLWMNQTHQIVTQNFIHPLFGNYTFSANFRFKSYMYLYHYSMLKWQNRNNTSLQMKLLAQFRKVYS